MEIFCTRNNGYQWTELPAGCFRGYFQLPSRPEPLRGKEALCCLSQAESFEGFQALLKDLDGSFSVILRREDGSIWAAVDSARSMPLYYSVDGRFISDSGPAVRKALGLPKEAANPAALEELFYCGFLAGSRTAYAQIAQLDAGQVLECTPSKGLCTVYYYAHIQKVRNVSREDAIDLFQQVSDEAFDRVIAAIAGRPVVLSLSGGYDSRYVACMLKHRGVEDVSCYTYGRKDSFEVQQSKKIAEALGYRWTFVEYTDQRILSILDGEGQAYTQANTFYDYHIYYQNFPAVQHLHKTGWIKPNSVFLTGLCNDMPTGFYEASLKNRFFDRFSMESFPEAVLPTFKRLSGVAQEAALSTIEAQRQGIALSPKDNYQSFASCVDCLWTIRDHSRQFLHMNDVHEFFGYEWLIPCWNRKLLEFWYALPIEYRLSQNIYEEWITTKIPAQYGIGQRKTVIGYPVVPGWERTKARARVLLNRLVYLPLGLPLRDPIDLNNFNPLMARLFLRLRQKHLIRFRNTTNTYILQLYLLEQRYGAHCLKRS